MKCPFCMGELPDDSEFCQYCGKRIVISSSRETQFYCKFCGKAVDVYISGESVDEEKTGRKVGILPLIILLVICILLVGANTYQWIHYRTLQEELVQDKETIEILEEKITSQASTIESMKDLIAGYKVWDSLWDSGKD